MMKNSRSNKGFTLAEMLIVVAILGILAGIGFVAVNTYVKSLKLTEMNGTAKEIFIAAQNQLSKAKADGRLDTLRTLPEDDKGVKIDDNTYYAVYNGSSADTGGKALDCLLGFGSIDNTVRDNGTYAIKYNIKTGDVTEVYYIDAAQHKGKSGWSLTKSDVETLNAGVEDQKNFRGFIIGHYKGDPTAVLDYTEVEKPKLTVTNDNILSTKIEEVAVSSRKVILCIKGVTSKAEYARELTKSEELQKFVLDDVTSASAHFAQVVSGSYVGEVKFLPGEDIEIYVTVQAKSSEGSTAIVLSNVAESDHIITNSLFAGISGPTDSKYTAKIANFRHLENLNQAVSNVNTSVSGNPDGRTKLTVGSAEQINNLTKTSVASEPDKDWNTFISSDDLSSPKVTSITGTAAEAGKYLPVDIAEENDLSKYDGKGLKIEGADIAIEADAGLFGTVNKAFEINNLELLNFNVSSSSAGKNSGALVATAAGALNVTNVIAYNCMPDPNDPTKTTTKGVDDKALSIKSADGIAGGLIGSMASGNITGCAAAVYVEGNTLAGGLIGTVYSGKVENSYAGAHTKDGVFDTANPASGSTAAARFNVISTGDGGKAGGLIGSADNSVQIRNSYSSCSVYGNSVHPIAGNFTLTLYPAEETDPTKKQPYYVCKDGAAGTNWYGTGWLKVSGTDQVLYPYFENTDREDGKILDGKKPTGEDRYNYDTYWDKDFYPYRVISDQTDDPWFLKTHVGDWAYPDYNANLINQKG